MKQIKLQPLNQDVEVATESTLLSVLLKQEMNVLQACGGQGRCATCHVYVRDGGDALSPKSEQEILTLSFITSSKANSRLACQARVWQDGIVIEVPQGMYIGSIGELKNLIGKRAQQNLIHPLTGEVLVEEGKLILRSALEKMAEIDSSFSTDLSQILLPPEKSTVASK
ncbi:2Fe-2S iron-sulfur cluster-binding protein [Pseudanabaena sp. UWO310]|uniref:2Fe-2S iron-sulfur cluster-binding protein n=1 Tax=Pseudanabaena sp. UWO310 TaxID=2480795 RepID=UPI0011591AF0|nr:2Fe-2S iron-sulfur cluster-binding protein [Pseudanabaena sp. UWO310]TYQ30908.1 2Fe-2S iron-sulfur cluster binding domain-containing protein [Pseudanabaena sp. UWO310]